MPNKEHAKQFTRLAVEYHKPRAGFDAYIAVWRGPRSEVVIGAPTLDALAEEWEDITGLRLQRERAQHVVLTYCDVPEVLMQQAKAAQEAGAPHVELRKQEDAT